MTNISLIFSSSLPSRVMSLEHIRESREVRPDLFMTGRTESTVAKSIQASKSRQDTSLHHGSDADMSTFLKDGYCDISRPDHDLQSLGQFVALRFFLPNFKMSRTNGKRGGLCQSRSSPLNNTLVY